MTDTIRSPLLLELMSTGAPRFCKKNSTIYATDANDQIVMVKSGFVKRYMIKNDGTIGVQIIYGPHDVFSFTKLYDGLLGQSIYDGPETYFYKAMSSCRIYVLSIEKLKQALATDPELYKDLFAEAGYHLRYCVHNIESVGLATAYKRVAHQLLFFVRVFGRQTAHGVELDVPLTHQDIADILGTTRETVSVAVMQLRRNGTINTTRRITVPDVRRLAEEAYA